ncbi:MAG: hypothetical protein AB7U43_12770 [Desulfobacter sp.]
MKHEDDAEIIDLYSFDESGVTGVPEIPYAWLDEDEPMLIPSGKTSRIKVLGFLGRQNDFILVIENYICLCAYGKKPTKKCIGTIISRCKKTRQDKKDRS